MNEEKFAKKIISALEQGSNVELPSHIEKRLSLARENAIKIAQNSRNSSVVVNSNGTLSFLLHKKLLAGFMFCFIMVVSLTYSHIMHEEYTGYEAAEAFNTVEADYSDALQLPEEIAAEE